MRQRIVGAIALAGGPKLIIADEPTTNLDVTIQAQYLDLLKELQEQTGVAIIFVTHNLGIVARMCDKLAVMYAGKIVEAGSVREPVRCRRSTPTPSALLGSMPKLGSKEKAVRHPRSAARSGDPAIGLRLSSALPGRIAALCGRAAARDPDRRRLDGTVLARRAAAHPGSRYRKGHPCRRRCWKLKA